MGFLRGKDQKRLAKLSLFGERAKQDRQLLVKSVVDLAKLDYQQYFLDFGAPESEQFPALLQQDISVSALKRVEQHTKSQFVFHVVIGGNTAFKPCMEYLAQLVAVLEGQFQIIAHPNEYSFVGPATPEQQALLEKFSQENHLGLIPFGNIDSQSGVGRQIIHYAQLGKGLGDYDFLEGLIMEEQIGRLTA